MGLDMYLHKKVYQYRRPDGTFTSEMSACTFDNFGRSNGTYLVTQAAYWRKANQIHKWFVDNVCDGNDDCKPYYCGRDKIEELVDICRKILGDLYHKIKLMGHIHQIGAVCGAQQVGE